MATIKVAVPDSTVRAARKAGLLTSRELNRVLKDALGRRRALKALEDIHARVAALGIPPMSMDDITAEVRAVRKQRRRAPGS
ncbi:MAG: hypothetical protein SFV21_05230 [Rhodospirillaceae bacterium]|nr:hypothetical protein [Rhodospirillaceae bacterium]